MLNIEHACPYCGQFVAINIMPETPPSEREKMAAQKCSCEKAARAREIADACDKLEQICGASSVENGFDFPIEEVAFEACRRGVEWLVDSVMAEIQVKCYRGDTVKMKLKNGNVMISRKSQKQMSL